MMDGKEDATATRLHMKPNNTLTAGRRGVGPFHCSPEASSKFHTLDPSVVDQGIIEGEHTISSKNVCSK
jgi:hypothetical protein